MAADLTGIDNTGEFFSQHYLSELLEKDLGDQSEATAAAVEQAQKALSALGREMARLLGEVALHQSPRALHELGRAFQIRVAEALGFAYQSGAFLPLAGGRGAPVLHLVERNGESYLAVLEGRPRLEKEALLDVPWVARLPIEAVNEGLKAPEREATLGDVVGWAFEVEHPPRWIVLVAGAEVVLAERARWGRGQYLRFDLRELLGRKDASALRITAALLARQSLVPDGGTLLHDRLDENSHKHAQGVSADLKYAAREAVELLANEWVHYQRTVSKKALHGERVARELTEECLVYLYRLLVLFYVEARAGELGLLPMNSPEYERGYSLEALRDLEQVTLGPEARSGTFFDESLRALFKLVNEGYPTRSGGNLSLAAASANEGLLERGFTIEGLQSPLFDERTTPRLSRVKMRNEVLQKVIRLLSLTPEARRARGGRGWGRGRISYAQLGINQLGAVYEGLLSYTGFFARDTLYEVHRAGAGAVAQDLTQQAWFVPERDLARYREDELLFEENGQKKHHKYEPGTFIYRLAGRDRESSASYYTPEVLTRCLVKYALKELLVGKTAGEILDLYVCEPAMGSGAFLVEAVDQLAEAYLERRQGELGKKVPPGEYAFEKQKVKAYLAEARCYGVDLNPMAAKLAGVSLWLATLHKGQRTPWFGARLAVGNSLVGARLEVWAAEDFQNDEALGKALSIVVKKQGESAELEAELERVLAAHERKHPEAVAEVRSRVERVKRLAGAPAEGEEGGEGEEASEDEQGKVQRKEVVKALKKLSSELKLPRHHRRPPRKVEAKAVVAGARPAGSVWHFLVPDAGMSPFEGDKVVAELAPEAVSKLKSWRKEVEEAWSPVEIGRLQALSARVDALYAAYFEARWRVLEGCAPVGEVWGQEVGERGFVSIEERERRLKELRGAGSAYARLKQVMDLWAALWAWPIHHAGLLPGREGWLSALEEVLNVEAGDGGRKGQLSIWPKGEDEEEEGVKGAATLWSAAEEAGARLRAMHWELAFPEVFVTRGGFDLVVGNPPWIKVEWNEQQFVEELDPRVALDGLSASDVAKRRKSLLSAEKSLLDYLVEFADVEGGKAFLTAKAYYPLLTGVQSNLYKSFLVHGWRTGSPTSVIALLHQEGILDDPRGGQLRQAFYERAHLILRFRNELRLFPDIGDVRPYAMSVSRANGSVPVRFLAAANLFHPRTVDDSLAHDDSGTVPGIKTDDGRFETRGHRSRVIEIGERELALFGRLFDRPGMPAFEARLPVVHSAEVLSVLAKLASHPRRLGDLEERPFGSEMWHETMAQKDGTIRRETRFPRSEAEWILSGPHFYVGNPLNKTPRAVCDTKAAYDILDAEHTADDYLPRTNYVPACMPVEYALRAPKYRDRPSFEFYRHVHREMISVTGERTLVSALIPPGPGHVHTVASVIVSDELDLVAWSGLSGSLVIDFLVRVKGAGHLQPKQALHLPAPVPGVLREQIAVRWLRLNALTSYYAPLWRTMFARMKSPWLWSSIDSRLSSARLEARWQRTSALRNHFERRWALVEIDALAALELNLTIDELCTIYRTQFPVLREYEKNTWYDQRGRIAFTTNRGLTGVGLDRKDFEFWQTALEEGKPLPRDFDTQNLEPPFELRDREADMRTAYTYFAEKLGKSAAS